MAKYGKTVKIWMFNVPVVIVSKPEDIQTVLNSPHCMEKDKRYLMARDAFGNGLLTAPCKSRVSRLEEDEKTKDNTKAAFVC